MLDGLTYHNNTPFKKCFTNCQVGHERHDTTTLPIILNGQPRVHEYPAIAPQYSMKFDMTIFDFKKYDGATNYCPGQDDIQRSLVCNGIWEGYETLLMLACLEQGGRMLDFGCNIGWFSCLARRMGSEVIAFETDEEMCQLARLNAPEATVINAWIDETSPKLPVMPVRFFKCDMEGAEKYAVRVCEDMFTSQSIYMALLEISPCFNQTYPQLVEWIIRCGYDVYQIPPKEFPYKGEFEIDPIGTLKRRCRLEPVGIGKYVEGLFQENFVFVRR